MNQPEYINLHSNGNQIANMFYTLDNLMFLAEHFPKAKHIHTTEQAVSYELL